MKHSRTRPLLAFFFTLFLTNISIAQKTKNFWQSTSSEEVSKKEINFYKAKPKVSSFFTLDIDGLKVALQDAPKRNAFRTSTTVS